MTNRGGPCSSERRKRRTVDYAQHRGDRQYRYYLGGVLLIGRRLDHSLGLEHPHGVDRIDSAVAIVPDIGEKRAAVQRGVKILHRVTVHPTDKLADTAVHYAWDVAAGRFSRSLL